MLDFVKYIKKASEDTVEKLELYRRLGVNLVLSEPQSEHKLEILNKVWSDVTKETNVKKYIEVAEVYIEYPITHLSFKETDILLKDILDHVSVDKQYHDYQTHLQSIMHKILSHSDAEFSKIFGMKNFLPFLDLFRGETQTDVNKALLANFNKTADKVSDTIIINLMFSIAKTVHDSITALSFDDEKREIAKLICTFIQKLDFGRDLEKHLNFFVEARRAFCNLDVVKSELVKGACTLAIRTQQIVKGKLNKQTSAFVRACIAYCFITIPSMELEFERLYLYALSGQVALLSQSLPQADSLFQSAITLVQEISGYIEERDGKKFSTTQDLLSFLKYFLSILVSVPGHPDHGPFYLLQALRKVIKEYEWEAKSTARLILYAHMITVMAANHQNALPYQWDKVDSNDLLYGRTQQFRLEIRTTIQSFLDDFKAEYDRLTQYEDGHSKSEQAEAILNLVNITITNAILSPECVSFIKGWLEIAKASRASKKQLDNTIELAKLHNLDLSQIFQ